MFGAWSHGQGYFGQGPLDIPALVIAGQYNTDWIVRCFSDDLAVRTYADDLVCVMRPDPVASMSGDTVVVVVPPSDHTVVM